MKRLLCTGVALVFLLAGCGTKAQSNGTQSSGQSGSEASSSGLPSSSAGEASSESLVQAEKIKVVIPEGYTLARIGMTLEEKGICTAREFIDATQNGDFTKYSLVAQQQANENRCFALEGYLFPATYEFSANASAEDVINAMLAALEQYMDDGIRQQVEASEYTFEEILAMASIIEKEAFGVDEMVKISSVLHNRLNVGQKIECDVSIKYVEGAIKPFIEGDKDRYNSFYNTYKCPALPAGPICSPGKAAVLAALNPATTNYYYFVTDADKNYYYGETWDEHKANIEEAGLNK